MQQTCIYEFLDVRDDPVYKAINSLQLGDMEMVGDIEISLNNFGVYESQTCDSHDSFGDCRSCYYHVCDLIEEVDGLCP